MIAAGMAPLGADYVDTLRRGCLEQRWVDHAINDGKSEGAFSYGTYDSHPFIMMSFDGNLSSMGTLAHELGHSMHSYYTRKYQPFLTATIRCSSPKSHQISTRRWCARIYSRSVTTAISNWR